MAASQAGEEIGGEGMKQFMHGDVSFTGLKMVTMQSIMSQMDSVRMGL